MTNGSESINANNVLEKVRSLYDSGLYLQAWRAGESLGPLKSWSGPDERALAARLSFHLGAPRLSFWHRAKAWRESPDHAETAYGYALLVAEHDGPYDAWRFITRYGELKNATTEEQAAWYALHAQFLALLRDFERAEQWMRRAIELAPLYAWLHTVNASVLSIQDRFEEALEADEESLRLRAWYRPAVQSKVHLLTVLNREGEGFAFLKEASQNMECGALFLQLASLLVEREEYSEAGLCLDKFHEYSPLLERAFANRFLYFRAHLAYHSGDYDRAVDYLRKSGDEIDLKLASRLSDLELRKEPCKSLTVRPIQQHHRTCVPTTLAMIGQFWNKPAEHLEVAERICYNGTSNYHERRWAEESGWYVKEFTVREESIRRAIDAGIPFTLTTHAPGGSHLQAVAGYDGRRGTLIIRDPSVRNRGEMFFETLEKEFGAYGPRGMAMVPVERRDLLETLDLPDNDLWNLLHTFDDALEKHHRAEAAEALSSMRKISANHVLVFTAQRRLADYDSDSLSELQAVDRLLEKYPENDLLKMSRLSLLRNNSRLAERLKLLEEECVRPNVNPLFLGMLAHELQQDSREQSRAVGLAQKAIRRFPTEASHYAILAHLYWDKRDFVEGLELYRFAACLDDKVESYADYYFRAAHHCRKTDEALDYLRQRHRAFGDKSSLPARTLNSALCRLERTTEGLQVLHEALQRRPEDGELKLYAAIAHLGNTAESVKVARELLKNAKGYCSEASWHRTAAQIASFEGNRAEALRCYREASELQPLNVQLYATIANLLSEIEGRHAALNYLRKLVEQLPHYQPLLECYADWLREESVEIREPVVRRLLELNPSNAWAMRELGFLLLKERRREEARQCCEAAGRLDPHASAWFHLKGELANVSGDLSEARRAFRDAIHLTIDDEYAIDELIRSCHTPEERLESLEFVRRELVRQVTYGDGLMSYRAHAEGVLDANALLEQLKEAHEARPDLWHAWVALALQQAAAQKLDEANQTIREACERFSLLPRVWYERSKISRLREDEEDMLFALEKARMINPHWHETIRALSDIYSRRGDYARARSLLEGALSHNSGDGVTRGWLADLLWRQNEKAAALAEIEKAVDACPTFDWAWARLHEWSENLKKPELTVNIARRLTERRPGDPYAWRMLAKCLEGETTGDERLEALKTAVSLAPNDVETYSLQARVLCELGRYEEALQVCRTTIEGNQVPPALTARAAWIHWEQGNRDLAVTTMNQALERDPSMYGCWQALADWHGERDERDRQLRATQEMLRLHPFGEVSLGYYGEALLHTGDRAGAKVALARAIEIEPTYEFPGNLLFDLYFDDKQFDSARELVDRLIAHAPTPFFLARAVRLEGHDSHSARAEKLLTQICSESPPWMLWPIRASYEVFEQCNWHAEVVRACNPLLDEGACHPETAEIVAHAMFASQPHTIEQRAIQLLDRPAGISLLRTWFKLLEAGDRYADFHDFLHRQEKMIVQNTEAWGYVVATLTGFRVWDEALPWIETWKQRTDAEAWMLVNVAEIYRVHSRKAEGTEVSRHALTLQESHAHTIHELWLSTDDIERHNYHGAADRLKKVDYETLDMDYQFLYRCVDACVQLGLSSTSRRRELMPTLRADFSKFADQYTNMHCEPARRQYYELTVRRMADLCGTLSARAWSWWRLWKLHFWK